MNLDARFMARALREAAKGSPSPNPHVGAVIVDGERIVSVGHHAVCGGAHAEVDAIRNAKGNTLGKTLYVSFEPCNHHGRTGPCTEAIIAASIRRVVVGCADPAPHVPGSAQRLRDAGIEVLIGVLEPDAKRMIADFAKHMMRGLPFVTLKAALTLDGRMATAKGDSKWITSEVARAEAHRMRATSDAVMVGIGTVLADDPELTVRHVRGKNPVRVVVDARLRTPLKSTLVRTATQTPTWIFHGAKASERAKAALVAQGVELFQARTLASGQLDLNAVLKVLARRNVVRLLVEGGPHLNGGLLNQGLVDRMAVFLAPKILGDAAALPLAFGKSRARMAQALNLDGLRIERFGPDILLTGDVVRT